jgi:hypothetical protein
MSQFTIKITGRINRFEKGTYRYPLAVLSKIEENPKPNLDRSDPLFVFNLSQKIGKKG